MASLVFNSEFVPVEIQFNYSQIWVEMFLIAHSATVFEVKAANILNINHFTKTSEEGIPWRSSG